MLQQTFLDRSWRVLIIEEHDHRLVEVRLSPLDAAALFWWARNQLYFDQDLWRDERIRIVRYERACSEPQALTEELSDYIGIKLPERSIMPKVRLRPDGAGDPELHPEVESLCQEAWDSFAGCPEL